MMLAYLLRRALPITIWSILGPRTVGTMWDPPRLAYR